VPEEAIESIDIDPSGTAGAAFLGTARLQKLERSKDEALSAAANVMRMQGERIAELVQQVTVLTAERSRLVTENDQLERRIQVLRDERDGRKAHYEGD
jgi:predicted RNase H-like nuclease (RuvC/YqgF family)